MDFQNRIFVFVAVVLLSTPFVAAELGLQLNADDGKPPGVVGDAETTAASLELASETVDHPNFDDGDGSPDDGDDSSLLPALPVTLSFTPPPSAAAAEPGCIYDFTVKDLDGNNVSLSKYEGRVLLIVNYARYCGLTGLNVENLSNMAKEYGQRGLTILMFPSNSFLQNFGGDECGKSLKISHPEFEVFSQISVNGYHQHPLYAFLKRATPGRRFLPKVIPWNFTKFLVDQNGHPVARFDPLTLYSKIDKAVQKLLNSAPTNAEISAELPSEPIVTEDQ